MEDVIRERLKDAIPSSYSNQVDAFGIVAANSNLFSKKENRVLDLGAGDGAAYEKLMKHIPGLQYVGLDLEDSPEVSQRSRQDLEFATYDGQCMPFLNKEFDIVFCKQVLEHVRHPDQVVGEAARVLRDGGVFVGSVSQLEPYHSHSIFNWTAYGISCVFEDAGLRLIGLRPGIDGISLVLRRIFGKDKFTNAFAMESIFNHYFDVQSAKRSHWQRNFQKIMIAGHICFLARKAA